jgi:hypothetical protein
MMRGPSAFYDVASILVTGVADALDESPAGRPDRACVVPGEIAWDGCDCGVLAVSPRSWTLSDAFPDVAGFTGVQATPCDLPWLVGTIEVQIVRCAPSPDGNVLSVSCARLDAAAEILVADAYLTITETVATLCELRLSEEIVDYALGEQLTVGPAGGCVGTSLTVQVALER